MGGAGAGLAAAAHAELAQDRRHVVFHGPAGKAQPLGDLSVAQPGGFIGRDAVLAQKQRGPLRRRLVQVLLTDPGPLMFHAEVVHRNGKPAGYIRSASYGFTLGGAVGLAMIDSDEPIDQAYLDSSEWTVQIGAAVYPAATSLRPMYDPGSKRIRM